MSKFQLNQAYISVDVETAGPNPAQYALLSIGACPVIQPENGFYVELQPDRDLSQPAAAVHGLSLETLKQHGLPPEQALVRFEAWLAELTPPGAHPVCVAFNAPFDWMFVCDYFHRYLGRNPFGHSALDIKAFYMGQGGVSWEQTSMSVLGRQFLDGQPLSHNALEDARRQALLFQKILEARDSGRQENKGDRI